MPATNFVVPRSALCAIPLLKQALEQIQAATSGTLPDTALTHNGEPLPDLTALINIAQGLITDIHAVVQEAFELADRQGAGPVAQLLDEVL